MIERDIRDLLLAINQLQAKNNINTTLKIRYNYDRRDKRIKTSYDITVWENNHPEETSVYSKLQVLSTLSLILEDLRKS